jgi:hypothetical protein
MVLWKAAGKDPRTKDFFRGSRPTHGNDAILHRDGDMFVVKKWIGPHGRLDALFYVRVGHNDRNSSAGDYN